MASAWQPQSVIAIDFGTSRSGFAFCLPPFTEVDIRHATWPGILGVGKTPTSLLLDQAGNIVAFGQSARTAFSTDVDQKFKLFENFKMSLWSDVSKDPMVAPIGGRLSDERPALDLISMSLNAISRVALEYVAKSLGIEAAHVSPLNQLWVVTIPAIWKDAAKALMREAALKAGIISKLYPNRLLLSFEPESAAVQCLCESQLELVDGTKFMVVDCGGGTVDITAHQIVSGLRFKSLIVPNGGDWGSTYVDQNYLEFIKRLVGPATYNELNASQLMGLRELWEQQKIQYTEGAVMVSIAPVCEILPTAELDKRIADFNARPFFVPPFPKVRPGGPPRRSPQVPAAELQIQRRGFGIHLPAPLVFSFFEPIFQLIAARVDDLVDDLQSSRVAGEPGLRYIFLAGGFSQSKALTSYLERHVNTRGAGWVIPRNPTVAVADGAARIGVTPDVIDSHTAALYYGVRVSNVVTSPSQHPGRPRTVHDGKEYVEMIDIMVEKGTECRRGEMVRRTYHPITADQSAISFGIYCSPNLGRYPHEFTLLATVSVDCPGVGEPPASRPVEARFSFAGTELEFTATNAQGDHQETSVQFS